jgi:hypothetical protein
MQSKNMENEALTQANNQEKVASTVETTKKELLIDNLGWSEEETKETYYRLLNFKEDWEAPGMEAYDEL